MHTASPFSPAVSVAASKPPFALYTMTSNQIIDFQSYAGPGDKGLRNTELEGYQPVSRIGETVMNSFSEFARSL